MLRGRDEEDRDARILRAIWNRERAHGMRPVWNPDARLRTRKATHPLRMDQNNEREAMKTRNGIEMVCARAEMRWQACREIARTAGWCAAVRAMTLGQAIQ